MKATIQGPTGASGARSVPLLTRLRRRHLVLRVIVLVVTAAFLNLYLQPLALAVNLSSPQRPVPHQPTAEEELGRHLEAIEEKLERLVHKLEKREDASQEKKQLKVLREQLEALDARALRGFDDIERHLKEKKLPQVILDRHYDAVRQYKQEMATLKSNLENIERERDDERLRSKSRKAQEHFKAKQKRRVHAPLDPSNLPFRKADGKARKPAERREDFRSLGLFAEKRVLVASVELLPGMLSAALSGSSLPTPDELASTTDAQITDEIKALATSLNHNPVQLYNWVRNNISFTPTFGSIQGSQGCYLSRECNATDTASLLIALLRASGIPARYVIGTIDVPIGSFKKYVGDFTSTEAALNFTASAGVPVRGVVSGGRVVAARMEHVWVEAWVDYVPSRGAVNKQGDTWVPIDGSLKPLVFQPPLDIEEVLGFDSESFAQPVLADAVQGPWGESVTGLSQAALQGRMTTLIDQLKSHISTNMQDATTGAVGGAVTIKQETVSVLPGNLPATVVAVGARVSSLPPSLRARVALSILDSFGIGEDLVVEWPTTEIANKRISIGYIPASPADAATVESYGGFYRTPAYLINVRPVVYQEGVAVTSGASVPMSAEQRLRVTFEEPDGRNEIVEHKITAGGFHAVGLNLQAVSTSALNNRKARLSATLERLGNEDVPWDEIVGEILNLHAAGYFLYSDISARLAANRLNVAYAKRPAEALLSYSPTFAYLFGIPRAVVSTDMQVDARRYLISPFSRTGEPGKDFQFMQIAGANASGAEHGVFEILQNAQAVSAVKLFTEANNRGVPILRIDASNASELLQQVTTSQEVIADIASAVQAGKSVIVTKDDVTVGQWTGAGYVVFDQQTGAGAYLIKGGLAGGGTAETSDILNVLEKILNVLGFSADTFGFLAKAGVALSVYATAVQDVSNVLAGLSILLSGVEVWNVTNSVWSGIAASVIDLALTLAAMPIAGWAFAALVSLNASPLLVSVFVALATAFILQLIKNIIFELLFGVVARNVRERKRIGKRAPGVVMILSA